MHFLLWLFRLAMPEERFICDLGFAVAVSDGGLTVAASDAGVTVANTTVETEVGCH